MAGVSPISAERRSADAATVSAAATANRADTPERWSIDGRLTQMPDEPGDDLQQVVADLGDEIGFLADQVDLGVDLQRVVRAHLGAEAVLERRDDAAAVRVVLGVRGRDEEYVERQPQRVAADLDVALLHHVQQRDLNAFGQVRQLVDGDDAAVRAGHQTEVDRLRVAEADGPAATFTGSTSPIRSPTEVSGVASFSA